MNREKFLKPFNGSAKLAAIEIGVTQGFISQCLIGIKNWPIKRVAEMNEAYGIPKYAMRPDLYPAPNKES